MNFMLVVRFRPEAMREALARRNQSQRDLALAINVEPSYLSALIRGDHEPSPRLRRRVLATLNLSFDDIFELFRLGQ